MHTFILQDYVTIRGITSVNVTQNESLWLDLTPYQDLVIWTDVREITGSVTVNFQTSPTKDESLFAPLVTPFAGATGVSQTKALMAGAAGSNVPIARYCRWVLTAPGTGPWDMTFRVYIAANSPGM